MNYPDLDLRSFLVLITAAVIQIITSGVINTCGLFPPEFMEFFNLSASTATYPATAIYVTTSAVGKYILSETLYNKMVDLRISRYKCV